MNSMVTVQFNSQLVASLGNQMKIYEKKMAKNQMKTGNIRHL